MKSSIKTRHVLIAVHLPQEKLRNNCLHLHPQTRTYPSDDSPSPASGGVPRHMNQQTGHPRPSPSTPPCPSPFVAEEIGPAHLWRRTVPFVAEIGRVSAAQPGPPEAGAIRRSRRTEVRLRNWFAAAAVRHLLVYRCCSVVSRCYPPRGGGRSDGAVL